MFLLSSLTHVKTLSERGVVWVSISAEDQTDLSVCEEVLHLAVLGSIKCLSLSLPVWFDQNACLHSDQMPVSLGWASSAGGDLIEDVYHGDMARSPKPPNQIIDINQNLCTGLTNKIIHVFHFIMQTFKHPLVRGRPVLCSGAAWPGPPPGTAAD